MVNTIILSQKKPIRQMKVVDSRLVYHLFIKINGNFRINLQNYNEVSLVFRKFLKRKKPNIKNKEVNLYVSKI